jgi:arabinan endo-1,5-alpha-L-arabinosidase
MNTERKMPKFLRGPCSIVVRIVAIGAFALVISGSSAAQTFSSAPRALQLTGEYRLTHDPSIIKEGDTYYVFATGTAYAPPPAPPAASGDTAGLAAAAPDAQNQAGRRGRVALGQLPIRCSHDLLAWKRCGQVFDTMPQWIKTSSPATKELWAPDISFFDGLYHLYYAYSAFGVNTSGIALATNKTLDSTSADYKWIDRGLVLKSTLQDDFNAIDPNLSIDEHGNTWLAFGSFWSGIKMRRLDRATGMPSAKDNKIYPLATRAMPAESGASKAGLPPDWEAIEAPFIIRHDRYYFLFVSWDLCCRGPKSTYRGMVGRSKRIAGPYIDKGGTPMMEGGGSPVLVANKEWVGPGGQSLLKLTDGYIIVFHAYDAKNGSPALHISTIGWKDGWPSASLEGDGH